MNDVVITDDAIPQDLADTLEEMMCTPRGSVSPLAWYFSDKITYDAKEYSNACMYKFIHMFFEFGVPKSNHYQTITPILDVLKCESIVDVRAFLTTYTGSSYQSEFHTDPQCPDLHTIKNRFTAIYYVNTNNGHTLFEDGQKVNSVKNRLCVFPSYKRHAAVTATDVKARAVINFNFWRLNERR